MSECLEHRPGRRQRGPDDRSRPDPEGAELEFDPISGECDLRGARGEAQGDGAEEEDREEKRS